MRKWVKRRKRSKSQRAKMKCIALRKSIVAQYYMEVFAKTNKKPLKKKDAKRIYSHIRSICADFGCKTLFLTICKDRISLYFQAPLYCKVQEMVNAVLERKIEALPDWDTNYNIYTVGLPLKFFKRAVSLRKEKYRFF